MVGWLWLWLWLWVWDSCLQETLRQRMNERAFFARLLVFVLKHLQVGVRVHVRVHVYEWVLFTSRSST